MSKVIITGVTGMDGSVMTDYLLKNTDHTIYGMVRRSAKPDYGNISHLFGNPRFKLVTGDLGDSQSIDNLVSELKPDYFINFAAQSFVGSSWQIPEQTFDAGAMGVLRCLEAIRKHVPLCRFYNAGSSEEFGDVEYSPQDEKHPSRPQSPYGAAKVAARNIVRVYRKSYNLYAIQGYLFNHEGVRRGEEFVTRKITKGVVRIYNAILNNQRIDPIELGNLDAKRDWSDAEDFVDGVWRMLNQEQYRLDRPFDLFVNYSEQTKYMSTFAKEYILSSNETHTVREFVELAFKEVGIEGKWDFPRNGKFNPEEEVYDHELGFLVKINPKFYRPAEVQLLLGDSTLARTELGWEPKTTFKELVAKMVKRDLEIYK